MILVWDRVGCEFDTFTAEQYEKAATTAPGRYDYVSFVAPAEEEEEAAVACIEQEEKFYRAVHRALMDFVEAYGVTSPQLELSFKKGAQAAYEFFTADP